MSNTEKYLYLFREVEELQETLSLKYGVGVQLSVKVVSKMTMDELYDTVTKVFHREFPTLFMFALSAHSRIRPLVIFRSIFFHFAKENGFRLREMTEKVDQNHATAIHGIKNLEQMLSINDFYAVRFYNMVKEEIDAK